jgi:hypothetical protein
MEQNRTERRQGNTGQKRKEDGNNETKKKAEAGAIRLEHRRNK